MTVLKSGRRRIAVAMAVIAAAATVPDPLDFRP